MDPTIIYKIAIWAVPIILAITLHEAGHAWAAYKLGDNTAKKLGRVSLNPVPHIDLIGTIILPLVMYLTSPFIFGWAKPVPVQTNQLHKPRRDMAIVALAGPGANFVMVALWVILYKVMLMLEPSAIVTGFSQMAMAGMFINLLLALFNLLPLPPLDGGRVLVSLLPPHLAYKLSKIERYGIIIVLLLFFVADLGRYLFGALVYSQTVIMNLAGIENSQFLIYEFFKALSA